MAVNLVTKPQPTDKTWEIVLVKDDMGVRIEAHRGNDDWILLTIKNDGTFYRPSNIGTDSGFRLTKSGKLVESKSER